jgi:UDP-N-acetylglucosamine--N-acetylmuramyl-(pentapeptide) pyrophosphoryl-undecaprenol N-acetylglucosamine transferase
MKETMSETMSETKDIILLAAGGTGGHMFPASALAEKLKQQNYELRLATDKRGMAYVAKLEAMRVHELPAATIYTGGLMALPAKIFILFWSFLRALGLLLRMKPKLIVGFGGYPSFGPVMAGLVLRIPVLVHEQNAVLGRVNRLAARMGAYVATSYGSTKNIPIKATTRLRRTGNPLRPNVLQAANSAYQPPGDGRMFELLVFGGSQGASVFAEILPQAVMQLPEQHQRRLRVVHQARLSDMRHLLDEYGKAPVQIEIRDFFNDLPMRMRQAHLVVARGGASTIAEITALAVPSIIIPLPGSLDQDQAHNVRDLAKAGGADLMPQDKFTADGLSEKLRRLIDDPDALLGMSKKAGGLSELDATGRLSRYSVCLARDLPVQIEPSKNAKPGEANG